MKRTILAVAASVGVLAGAAGAAVNAQQPTPTPQAAIATPASTPPPIDVSATPGRTADGRYLPGWLHYRKTGQKIAVRVPDPAGGPGFAVSLFNADRLVVDKPTRSLRTARVVGRHRCVQLGRVQTDTFGWVYGDGRFARRAGVDEPLIQCTERNQPKPLGQLLSVLAVRDPAAPTITHTLIWGLLPGAERATVNGLAGANGDAHTSDGAFLQIAGPEIRPSAGAAVRGGGLNVRLSSGSAQAGSRPPRIEAPAPDPSGGPRWGLAVAQTRDGRACVLGATRAVDGRGGDVDLRLAIFKERRISSRECGTRATTPPTAERPCEISWGSGNAEELEGGDGFLARARTERRLLAGRTTIQGRCADTVERVTLETPRDVRTLIPSQIGHAVLAVYDGDFVGGTGKLTAHLRGGKTWTQEIMLGTP